MAVLFPAKRSGSLLTGVVLAPVQAVRVRKISFLKGIDATNVEYVIIQKYVLLKFLCLITSKKENVCQFLSL